MWKFGELLNELELLIVMLVCLKFWVFFVFSVVCLFGVYRCRVVFRVVWCVLVVVGVSDIFFISCELEMSICVF